MENKTESNLEAEKLIKTKGFKPGEKVFSVDQMRIAVMPKKFSKTSARGNTKGIGIFIVLLGAIFLIAISVSAYWYFFKYEPGKNQVEKSALNVVDDNLSGLAKEKNIQKESSQQKEKSALNVANDNLSNSAKEKNIQKEISKNVVKNTSVNRENNLNTNIQEENIKKEDGKNILLEDIKKTATSSEKVIVKKVSTTSDEKIVQKETKDYKKALDSDLDGLFDPEENLLACSSSLKDSDQDGYNDLSEFLNLYNPSGKGELIVNSGIEEYRNGNYNYKIYYPKIWKPIESQEGASLIFNIDSNDFIEIIVQENKEGVDLETWFKKQFNTNAINSSQIIYKKGWVGYRSDDKLTVYLNRPGENEIYAFSYSLPPGGTLSYPNIFQMMINSFDLTK